MSGISTPEENLRNSESSGLHHDNCSKHLDERGEIAKLREEIDKLRGPNNPNTIMYKERIRQLEKERDAFQTQAGARKRENYLLRQGLLSIITTINNLLGDRI